MDAKDRDTAYRSAIELLGDAFPGAIVPLVVGGDEWIREDRAEIEDPSTGSVIAEAVLASPDDAAAAVGEAKRAGGDWGDRSSSERGRILLDCARLLEEQLEPLAALTTLETGKPLRQSLADARAAVRYFEYYGGAADKLMGTTIDLGRSRRGRTQREPFGVTLHIIPWNSPLSQFARGVAPATAAGNTAVVKTATRAPMAVALAGRIVQNAALPPGVCNVVTGPGAVIGDRLLGDPDVQMIVFTGSTTTGKAVARAAAERIVPVHLELGGKSAVLVFADADLNAGVAAAVHALSRNSGQSCYASTRFVVADDVYDEFCRLLIQSVQKLSIGPGILEPDLGPLSDAAHLGQVLVSISEAVKDGARILFGGRQIAANGGYFLEPTVVDNVGPEHPIAQEELFAPVICLFRATGEHQAIAVANGTRYGLAAGIFTRDLSRAERVARRLKAGQVHINAPAFGGVELPFGGYGESGIGREKGFDALLEYTQIKTVVSTINPD